ncbi:MAG: C45 family peptidase [Thermodesulfobacteriota bacterium]|nr:C45 family peptidase [Thermodesulfobacteriota bacterium]
MQIKNAWRLMVMAVVLTILSISAVPSVSAMGLRPPWPDGLEDKYNVSEIDPSTGKQMIHVEGTPYERGFAIGYEFPEETMRNCSNEYYIAVVKVMMGDWVEPLTNFDRLVEFVKEAVLKATKVHKCQIPDEYMEEMEGIVDGVKRAKPFADFELDDILMLNLSIDVITSIQGDILDFLGIPSSLLYTSCHGFVATGNATIDGRTIMGRHFMFPPEVFNETCLVIEHVPDNGYPFVSITPPGYVGVTSAMNNQGIGIGMDVLLGAPTNYWQVGMGRLMLARDVIQYAGSLDDAVLMMRSADIGSGNIFIIGDGAGDGAIIECHADAVAVRYLDATYDNADYNDPDNQQEQIEDKSDLALVANHAVVPEIANESAGRGDSLVRYETLCGLLLDSYGSLDTDNSRDIIDFLHPPSWYYGDDVNQPVAASVTLFDLTSRELWSLYGNYSDPWVHHRLDY